MSQPYEPYPTQPDPQSPSYGATNPYYAQPLFQPLKELTATGTLSAAAAAVVALATVGTAVTTGPAIDAGPSGIDLAVAANGACALITVVGLLAGFVTTGLWLHAARTNAEALEPTFAHTRSSGWAWGGWVCPIVSLWFPFQVVRDVYRASTSGRATTPLIGWWWALWVIGQFLDRISSRVGDAATTNGQNADSAVALAWIVAIVLVAAAALWGLTVRSITAAQHARMRGVTP